MRRPTDMTEIFTRRPIIVAAAMLTGIVALVAGYAESQAASQFVLEAASVGPQALYDETPAPAVQPAERGKVIPKAVVKVHPRATAKADFPAQSYEIATTSDVPDAQTRFSLPSGEATFRVSVRVDTDGGTATDRSHSTEDRSLRARRELLAEAAEELRRIPAIAWPERAGMMMIDHGQKPSGN